MPQMVLGKIDGTACLLRGASRGRLSPLYSWSTLTAAGLVVVTACLLLDVVAKRS